MGPRRTRRSPRQGTVAPAQSAAEQEACLDIRLAVFVREQGVPETAERDVHDAEAFHVLARDGAGRPVATGRFYVHEGEAKIGRMAVVREARGAGWGRRVIEVLEAEARARGLCHARLDAQTHAIPFYARLGYAAEGPEFMDCGIPHRRMRKPLEPRKR